MKRARDFNVHLTMRLLFLRFRVAAVFLLGAGLFPGIADAITVTTESAATMAVHENPSLAAARHRVEEARGRLTNAGRLANPEAEFEFAQNPRMPERRFAVGWMQKFPITARLRLEKAVSRAELDAAVAEIRDAERKIAGEARALAVRLLILEMQRELRGQQITNSEELSAFAQRRLATGEASAVDAIQMELETQQLGTQLLQLDVDQATLLGELRLLLGLKPNAPLSVRGELATPGKLPPSTASLDRRPDYRSAQAASEAAERMIALQRANKWEDIGVGLMAEHERMMDAPEGFERATMLGFRVTVPLPLWNKNEGRIQEAAAAARRAEQQVAAVAAQVRAEVATARAEMAATAAIIAKINDTLAPQTVRIEEQVRGAYQAGQTPLSEVIRARALRFQVEAQRLDALRDYHLASARYKTAIGTAPAPAQRAGK